MAVVCSDKLMENGVQFMWEGRSGRECETGAKQADHTACLSQQISSNKQSGRLSCDNTHLNNTLAADVSCRCPVKIKDGAMNAINELWVGVSRNGLRGKFKRMLLCLDADRRGACPCRVPDYLFI